MYICAYIYIYIGRPLQVPAKGPQGQVLREAPNKRQIAINKQ